VPDSLFLSLQQRIDFSSPTKYLESQREEKREFECLYATVQAAQSIAILAPGSARNAPQRTVVVGADMVTGLLGIVYQEKAY